jgi:3',5'-cyclic-AMP phosphodiesterase
MLFVQISDPHVLGDRNTEQRHRLYAGTVDTAAVLSRVIAAVNALDPRPELVLLTGDIAALTGETGDYVAARAVLDSLEIPYLPVPGNHDLRAGMRQAFGVLDLWDDSREHLSTHRNYGGIEFIGLDTLIEGEPGGRFGTEQLDWLECELAATAGNPTVLFMHHPPFEAGWPFADPIRALDGHLLEAIVARHSNILAVLCGHLHRPMIHRFGGTIGFAAPASSRQGWADLREGYRHRWTNEPPAFVQHLVHEGMLTSFIVPLEDEPA